MPLLLVPLALACIARSAWLSRARQPQGVAFEWAQLGMAIAGVNLILVVVT